MTNKKIIRLPAKTVSLPEAWEIVKYKLDDDSISIRLKALAIELVANMPTHNSIKKDDLIRALRWLFEHYDFEED